MMSWSDLRYEAIALLNAVHLHVPSGEPPIFLIATPRGGSTWLFELLTSQPGILGCDEPFHMRNPTVRRTLGLSTWLDLYNQDAEPAIRRYLRGICNGTIRSRGLNPWKRNYRFVSRRVAFKLIHACEDRINWLRDELNGRIVLLTRHPIPVSLSRQELPRLAAFVGSDYARHFSTSQLRLARRIIDSGTTLEKGVLHWCFETAIPLRDVQEDWTVVTYEQLVLDPYPLIQRLVHRLDLRRPEAMMARVLRASGTLSLSSRERRAMFTQPADEQRGRVLIEAWRQKVGPHDERRLMEIVQEFGIDLYRVGDILPHDRYWLDPREGIPRGITEPTRAVR